jgi:hypothetical protein
MTMHWIAARLRVFAADFLDGLDSGLTELLWTLGIDRASRAQRRAAAAFAAQMERR